MYEVGIVGGVAGFDFVLAEGLARKGFHCSVAIKEGELDSRTTRPPARLRTAWDAAGLSEYRSRLELLSWARTCRIVVSMTGGLLFGLGPLWFVRRMFGTPPVVACSTGSDLAELAVADGRLGWALRAYLRSVEVNWCLPYPSVLENIRRLRIPRVAFMDFPYDLRASEELNVDLERHLRRSGPLRIFHSSNLDWGVTDPGPERRSAKGNDRFLRAFASALDAGLDARLMIVARGPDLGPARQLVRDLALDPRVEWLPELERDELFLQMIEADVVVDQFDVGGLGGIAVEAMSLGAPVLTYVDERAARVQYGADLPPVLNASVEEEIRTRLMGAADRQELCFLGRRAASWAVAHHRWDHCLDRFVICYESLSGRRGPAQ
ncbi:MAG: glycosyltransferase [Elusimicrobia bacterium]|nr:glycosyltransferase [Elusimicrobiota bacterium]